jgi:hypothetical protein
MMKQLEFCLSLLHCKEPCVYWLSLREQSRPLLPLQAVERSRPHRGCRPLASTSSQRAAVLVAELDGLGSKVAGVNGVRAKDYLERKILP